MMRHKRHEYVAATLLVILAGGIPAHGEVIESTFDTDDEGWTGYNLAVSFTSTGGNPGGYLQVSDEPFESYAIAPSKFSGNLTQYNGGTISYDFIKIDGKGGQSAGHGGEVTIEGTNGSLAVIDMHDEDPAVGTWNSASLPFAFSSSDRIETDWLAILADVKEIRMVADLTDAGNDVAGIDNFAIAPVPEPSPLALMLTGITAMWLIRYACARRHCRQRP